jgi:hypothetical protein
MPTVAIALDAVHSDESLFQSSVRLSHNEIGSFLHRPLDLLLHATHIALLGDYCSNFDLWRVHLDIKLELILTLPLPLIHVNFGS